MSDIPSLAQKLTSPPHPLKTLPTPRQIRIFFNATLIATTTHAVYVWEVPYYPALYLPLPALSPPTHTLTKTSTLATGAAEQYTLSVGEKSTDEVLHFPRTGLVRIPFAAMDAWFEEDVQISVHPKDPFKRVDALPSGREVVVRLGGREVARSRESVHLYETGLPVRYYLPRGDVDGKVLRGSARRTGCPYKGWAGWWDVVFEDGREWRDAVWGYERAELECKAIEGMLCFYNEKVEIELDGEILEQPVTHLGSGKPDDKPSIV